MASEHLIQERLVIRLFGALRIEDGERMLGPRDLGGARPKQVLEILLMARGHRVPTDRLAELLWPQERPRDAAAALQTFVSMLRRRLVDDRHLARELVVTETEAYRFATDLVGFDLDQFDELVERSAGAATRDARRLLEQALALVRGDVLEDEPYALWAQDLRGMYQGRVLGARLDAADAALAELDYAAALAHAEAGIVLDRFSERAHSIAMLALYALGRQHDALDTYRGFRGLLADELGLEPTAETRTLESAILRQEDVRSLLPRPIGRHDATAVSSPSVRLLGRTTELAALEQDVSQALDGSFALVLIEGEAGIGKTRLLDELATLSVDARVGRARCSPLEQHLSYVPIAAALRGALAGIELGARNRPALGQILPELASASSRESTEVEVLEALADLFAEHAPLLLLIDDLHWADQATLAAISYVQRRCAGVGAALVTAARSEELPPGHCVRRLQPDTVVRLEPLTRNELAPLRIPDLHGLTGGNPRLVSETLMEGTEAELSASFADALLAQCRAEGPWAYRVLVTASVFEQPFEPEPVAVLLDVDVVELIEELERLCERRVLIVDGLRFGFRYQLVREVLLRSLSPARRRLLRDRLRDPRDDLTSARELTADAR